MATANAEPMQEQRSILGRRAPVEVMALPHSVGFVDADTCERIYRDAEREGSRVPWARLTPDPTLLRWLNSCACEHVRPGSRALVAGCGLGDDVAELATRGFDAVGIDACPEAVAWAQSRFPDHAGAFVQADLRQPPARMHRRFDVIIDVDTMDAWADCPTAREEMAAGISSLMHPRGCALVIAGEDPSAAVQHRSARCDAMCRETLISLMAGKGLRLATWLADTGSSDDSYRFAGVFRKAE